MRRGKTLGLRPKPCLEPSFGEGSKDSKNFTAKGTRRGGTWRHVLRFRVPFAVKLWNSWDFSGRRFQAGFGVVPQNLPLRFARFESRGGVIALRGYVRLFRPHPALACHLPHPGEGLGWVRLLKNYLLTKVASCQKIDAVSKSHGTAAVAFPPGGEGGAKRRMRAKSANALHNASHQHPTSSVHPTPLSPTVSS